MVHMMNGVDHQESEDHQDVQNPTLQEGEDHQDVQHPSPVEGENHTILNAYTQNAPTTFKLPEDTYTMLMSCETWSCGTAIFALAVVCLQYILMGAILWELIRGNDGAPFLSCSVRGLLIFVVVRCIPLLTKNYNCLFSFFLVLLFCTLSHCQ